MKMMIKMLRCGAWAVLCSAILCLPIVSSAEGEAVEFSQAESLLWLTDQLKTVKQPSVFTYQFERTGTLEPSFSDTVRFTVSALNDDGMKTASMEFFTGERRFEVPAVASTNVNPVLKIYLQGDVYEMNRLTDPDAKSKERWRYFQRRIKFALADTATVEETTITFEGREYAAHEVSFSPYVKDVKLSDPNLSNASTRPLYGRLIEKTYKVTVSDELPGYLFRVETEVPAVSAGAEPLIREVLQLVGSNTLIDTKDSLTTGE